tara:strand:+ start:370 stop:867 length:498 start_codon:yes stop_codon:yes gene_type:complete
MNEKKVFIHNTAQVDQDVQIGVGTNVWMNVQIREEAKIGVDCIISKDVYIDRYVKIGDRCKIQNGVYIYNGVIIEDDVFVGPNVSFTNDKVPRAFNHNWKILKTHIANGASIGANSTIICGVNIGEYSMVGAGCIVTKDVPPYTLVLGSPAIPICNIDKEGNKVS